MKVLITTMPAAAHLYPYVPLAWALQSAGHEVRVASHPDMADTIVKAGLTAVAVGEKEDLAGAVRAAGEDERLRRIVDALPFGPGDANFKTAIGHYVLGAFGLYYPEDPPGPDRRPMVDDLIGFARSWRPDLVLWDPLSFPSPVAARACGAAHARVLWAIDHMGWTRSRLLERLEGLDRLDSPRSRPREDPLDPMASMMKPTLRRLGHDFDEELIVGQWTVDLMPPRMRLPVDLRYVPVQMVPYTGADVLPEWLYERPSRPRVCLTLGLSSRHFFAKNYGIPVGDLLDMVADLDIEMVATLNDAQLASVDRVPPNVKVVDYVPLTQLLPTCSAIIHHGGAGTFAAAVSARVPQLVIPTEGAERVEVGDHVALRGAGLSMPTVESGLLTVDDVKKSLVRILNEPSFRRGAGELRADLAATPSPRDAVPILEDLTVEHRR
ncbi:activator-dependent family glycosyltransferase [Actinomadura sp. 7K507]|nr:activator-dependent family glycosyltransferase [Actinomadura sp. 7K507]